MKRIHLCLAFFLAIFVSSCQQASDNVEPNYGLPSKSGSAREAEEFASDPDFYSIVYSDHGSLTVSQYIKRARKSGISTYNLGNELISSIANWNSGAHTSIQNQNRNDLVNALNSSSNIPKYVPYSGKYTIVYRGGNDFTPRDPSSPTATDGDYRINSSNGLVRTEYGLSLELDYKKPYISGNGYKITYLPAGLKIIQRGVRPDHHEIVPTQEISVTQYKSLMSQIQSEAAQ